MDRVHPNGRVAERVEGLQESDADSDGRAVAFQPWRVRSVPIRAFHAAWASFFLAMFVSFAPAALTVPIRDTLNLDESDIALGNALTLAGTALCRILLGSFCDFYGPKVVMIALLLTTTIPLSFIAIVRRPIGHIVCRPLIGLSMGCQTVSLAWCSLMFADDIVGTSNAATLGLAEAGFGCSQLLMPLLFVLCSQRLEPFIAWRVSLLIPGSLQLLLSIYVIFATQDQPNGSIRSSSRRQLNKYFSRRTWLVAVSNYRTWIFAAVYGTVLGIGLSIYNIITAYYFDNFDVSFQVAGALGSLAGLVNVIYMPLGGYMSDFVARKSGMRGRLWLVACSTVALGITLVLLSRAHKSLTLSVVAMQFVLAFIALIAAALFSVTPFVSHRALGLVQGIVGSGANVIGAIIQEVLFNKARMDTHKGFFWAGVITIISTSLLATIYYPMWGSLFTKARPGARESDYYLLEYTPEEIQMGLAEKSVRYAKKATIERGALRS